MLQASGVWVHFLYCEVKLRWRVWGALLSDKVIQYFCERNRQNKVVEIEWSQDGLKYLFCFWDSPTGFWEPHFGAQMLAALCHPGGWLLTIPSLPYFMSSAIPYACPTWWQSGLHLMILESFLSLTFFVGKWGVIGLLWGCLSNALYLVEIR